MTQGFKTKVSIPSGSVVSLTKGSSDTVEKTTTDNEDSIVGVTASAKDSIIDLQPAGSLIRVAVSGDTSILVTDLNGDIKTGDQLIISPLAGIAMRQTLDTISKKIIATAGANFGSSSVSFTKVQVDQIGGGKKSVLVGKITAKLILNDQPKVNVSQHQNLLSSIGQRLTGKQTSPTKVIAAAVVAVSTLALSGLILNGSVRGSFISLGRNPLSKDTILNGLLKTSLLAILIISTGLALAYVILLV
ncbi:hypothetical protein HY218_02060 [Candidatus Saccharibacteria bacterium]|nr:hypothetical protein [Candidatus Saccharibacteria bacterium]